jgi:hypothetical protein
MRFETDGLDVIRRSPHGDVTVAKCHSAAWAREIARLLNEEDKK